MLAKLRSQMTYANVMVTALMFIVLGGGAYAAFRLPADSVKSKHIAPDAAKGVDVDEASLASAILQSRVRGICQEGQAIQSVTSTGAVTCETALQGEPGTPGAPGAPGVDGVSFIWQGAWNEGQEYAPNDVVSHLGSSWIATKDERPCEPGSEGCAQWELLAQKGEPGQDGSSDTAQQVLDKLLTVDGATSGLDADKLDNLDATNFARASGATFTDVQLTPTGLGGDCPIDGPSGWYHYRPTVFNPVGYYRDPFGIVHLRGLARNCSASTNVVVTLPEGYQPRRIERHATVNADSDTGIVRISSDGQVSPEFGGLGPSKSLDGITFRCSPPGQNGCP